MPLTDQIPTLRQAVGWLRMMKRYSRPFIIFWWLVVGPAIPTAWYGLVSVYLTDQIEMAQADPERGQQFLHSISIPPDFLLITAACFTAGLVMWFHRDTPIIRWILVSIICLLNCIACLRMHNRMDGIEWYWIDQVTCILCWIFAVPVMYYLCTDHSGQHPASPMGVVELPSH